MNSESKGSVAGEQPADRSSDNWASKIGALYSKGREKDVSVSKDFVRSPNRAAGALTIGVISAAVAAAVLLFSGGKADAVTAKNIVVAQAEAPSGEAGPASNAPAPGAAGESSSQRHAFRAPGGEEPDWPCEQRYVADLSWGTIWTGPNLDEPLKTWERDALARDQAVAVASDDTEEKDGVKMIDAFASKLTGSDKEKDKELTTLFAGIFDSMNSQRSAMLRGIKRFVGRQAAVVKKLNELQDKARAMEAKGIEKYDPKMSDLNKQIYWNTRVYDERNKLTHYVCDEPILLEERLGAYARAVEAHLSTSKGKVNPG